METSLLSEIRIVKVTGIQYLKKIFLKIWDWKNVKYVHNNIEVVNSKISFKNEFKLLIAFLKNKNKLNGSLLLLNKNNISFMTF